MPRNKICYAVYLGLREYSEILQLQDQICEMKKQGFDSDILLLLEHPPTITLGRNAKWKHVLAPIETLEAKGIRICEVDRGGDVTFHGPGQLVSYPLLALADHERGVRRYMGNLEEVLIRVLERYGVASGREDSRTGVWTNRGKIAAMGVHINRWITRHGVALNVHTDLSFFDFIVPCGIRASVTSMKAILDRTIDVRTVAADFVSDFADVFHREVVSITAPELNLKMSAFSRGLLLTGS